MNKLFVEYVLMVLGEDASARVPNQLVVAPKHEKDKDDELIFDESDEINEFSGVGAIMGYSAPLGMNPGALGRKNNSKKTKT